MAGVNVHSLDPEIIWADQDYLINIELIPHIQEIQLSSFYPNNLCLWTIISQMS